MMEEKIHHGMYSSKFRNKNIVADNAYISVGDPYNDPMRNPFRQPTKMTGKKGEEKSTIPFQVKVNDLRNERM
jgi:hypothetical protein